jgi:hypothetical protein
MIGFSTTLLHGLFICLPFSVFAVLTFWCWPRLWLHSLPPDIAEMAGSKTDAEIRNTRWLVLPVLIILPGLSVASALYAGQATHTDLTVLGAFIHIYGIWLVVHLWDLVIIDFGHVLLIDPQRPPVPNTEGASGYKDYRFHFDAFLKACRLSLLFVVPAAVVVGMVA